MLAVSLAEGMELARGMSFSKVCSVATVADEGSVTECAVSEDFSTGNFDFCGDDFFVCNKHTPSSLYNFSLGDLV